MYTEVPGSAFKICGQQSRSMLSLEKRWEIMRRQVETRGEQQHHLVLRHSEGWQAELEQSVTWMLRKEEIEQKGDSSISS